MFTELAALSTEAADAQVPFGRNRLLKLFGAGLFGFAAQMVVRRNPAWAGHQPPMGPCYTYPRCHCCSGSTCTCSTCGYYHYEGCPTGGQCWSACYSNCVWNCCDWMYTSGSTWKHCLCGTCVSGTYC